MLATSWATSVEAQQPSNPGRSGVRQASYSSDEAQSSRLNWRRRESGRSQLGLAGPQNNGPSARVASKDPINDPFGDRRSAPVRQETPTPAAPLQTYTPPVASEVAPRTLPARTTSMRRSFQDDTYQSDPSTTVGQRVGCEQLSSSPITSIQFTLAPSLFPGQSEDIRVMFRGFLRELITNPYRNWTTTDRNAPDGQGPVIEGRFKDFGVEKDVIERLYVIVTTRAGEDVRIDGPLTPDTYYAAKIMQTNIEQDWVDKSGRVAARGWFVDYVNDSVIIRTVEGEEIPIRYNDLATGSLATVTDLWELPYECGVPESGSMARNWTPSTYTWKASALCHKPFYFEDIQLERYGHSAGPVLQELRSGAHFFLNIAALPYNIGVHTPNECQYTLGYYRPGNCAPFRGYALPLSARGALTATGFYVGLPYIIP